MSSLIKKIEDLEKKNQELCIDLNAYQNENENLVKDIEKYWKLEQELGCPLEVVFKALKDGKIYFEDGTYSTDFVLQKTPAWAFAIYDNIINNKEIVIIKDYQKTWWLKGEQQ